MQLLLVGYGKMGRMVEGWPANMDAQWPASSIHSSRRARTGLTPIGGGTLMSR
jgi:hypothetical protein